MKLIAAYDKTQIICIPFYHRSFDMQIINKKCHNLLIIIIIIIIIIMFLQDIKVSVFESPND